LTNLIPNRTAVHTIADHKKYEKFQPTIPAVLHCK